MNLSALQVIGVHKSDSTTDNKYTFLSTAKRQDNQSIDIDKAKRTELMCIGELLGADVCDVYRLIEPEKEKLITLFGNHILASLGPLDGFGNPDFKYLKADDEHKKRLARIQELSGGGLLGKCNRYMSAFKRRTSIEARTLFLQTLYYVLERQAEYADVSADTLQFIKKYLTEKPDLNPKEKLFDYLNNDKACTWVKEKILNGDLLFNSYLLYLTHGQRILYESAKYEDKSRLPLSGKSQPDENLDPLNHILLILNGQKDSREYLYALEEFAQLKRISCLNETFQITPNWLALRIYRIQSATENTLSELDKGITRRFFNRVKGIFAEQDVLWKKIDHLKIKKNDCIENIMDNVEDIVLSAVCEAYLKEKELVQEIYRASRRKALTIGAITTTVLATGGAGSYWAVNNLSSSRNQIFDLQTNLNELINRYQTTDLGKLYSDACTRANENMKINNTTNPIEWNTKIFRILSVYLEPEPSEELLREELNKFQNLVLPRIRNNPANSGDIPEIEKVIQRFQDYFAGQINRQILSQDLMRLHDRIKRHLRDSFKTLISNYVISTRQIIVPPDVLSNLTPGLREIFNDDYFKAIVLRGIREDQFPVQAYRGFCTPIRMIGPEATTIDSGSGFLTLLITGMQPIDTQVRRVNASYVLRCFSGSQIYERIKNHLISRVAGLRNNQENLQRTANNLRTLTDIEQIRQMIEAKRHELDLFTRELCPAYAYVLTGFHRAADGLRNCTKQLGIEWNPSHPQL